MAIAGLAVKDRLGEITTPTLVVAGSLDTATPPATGAEPIAAAIPGAKLVTLPTGHISALERPDALAALLAEFFGAGAEDAAQAGRDALFEAGLLNRRAVLGDAWVERALAKKGGFSWEFQQFITRFAWSEVWGRPGLDHRTRRIIVLAITLALGRWEEFRLHTRAALEQKGLTEEEVREVLIQAAIYAGVPAANTAFALTEEIISALRPE
jgi:3-oxoadipate enol-lactonase/4-carboxymuconolactone decarboxylase